MARAEKKIARILYELGSTGSIAKSLRTGTYILQRKRVLFLNESHTWY